eukprot:3007299-Amphidinium_carterae.1
MLGSSLHIIIRRLLHAGCMLRCRSLSPAFAASRERVNWGEHGRASKRHASSTTTTAFQLFEFVSHRSVCLLQRTKACTLFFLDLLEPQDAI